MPETKLTRRLLVGGAAAAPLLAACSEETPEGAPAEARSTPEGSPSSASPPASPTAEPTSAPRGTPLTSTGDVPEGGGVVFGDDEVVVTQPRAGEFKGFSAICTHEGCTVGEVADGTINCPCHGSRYAIADGSVTGGPAPDPLPPVEIVVDGDQILLP